MENDRFSVLLKMFSQFLSVPDTQNHKSRIPFFGWQHLVRRKATDQQLVTAEVSRHLQGSWHRAQQILDAAVPLLGCCGGCALVPGMWCSL